MDSSTLPKAVADMTKQEVCDAIVHLEAVIAELDKTDAEKLQGVRNLHDRNNSETTNKMGPPALFKAAADMTRKEARNAIIQWKADILELDKTNAEKVQRPRELHDRHKSRRRVLTDINTVADADPDNESGKEEEEEDSARRRRRRREQEPIT
jgi:hypothetical protein